jgi:hypothetical protein
MDARTQTQLRKLSEQHAPHLTAALDELILQSPRLADGGIHDPREPVFHASTAADGYPPLEVEFDPSVGYHVIVFLDHLDTPRQSRVPIFECERTPDACEQRRRAARTSGAHQIPAGNQGAAIQSTD